MSYISGYIQCMGEEERRSGEGKRVWERQEGAGGGREEGGGGKREGEERLQEWGVGEGGGDGKG